MDIKSITVRLYPNKKQIELFEKCVKYRNYCYNYGIDFVNKNYIKTGKFTNFVSICNDFKKFELKEEFKECSSKIPPLVFKDVIQAFKNFLMGEKIILDIKMRKQ